MTSHLRAALFAPLLAILFFVLAPGISHAATLSLQPLAASFSAGDTFTETVIVASSGEALNAVSGELSFPPELLEVIHLSKANSILSLWVQEPSFINAVGTVTWGGIVPNPGFAGEGTVLTITFRAKASGEALLSFSASAVLANDGSGTNILTSAQSAQLTIGAFPAPSVDDTDPALRAVITSSLEPGGEGRLPLATFNWINAPGVTAVRLGADRNPNGIPSVLYTEPISRKQVALEPGVWYFHVQEKGARGWGPVSTHEIMVPESGSASSPFVSAGTRSSLFSIAWIALNYVSLALIALALIAVLLYAARYALLRYTQYGEAARAELETTEAALAKEFERLKHLIAEEVLTLERVKLRRQLTSDEERLVSRVKAFMELNAKTKGKTGPSKKKQDEALARIEEAIALSEQVIEPQVSKGA